MSRTDKHAELRTDKETVKNIIPYLTDRPHRADAEKDVLETIGRLRFICGDPKSRNIPTQGFDVPNRDWLRDIQEQASELRKMLGRPGIGVQIEHALFAPAEMTAAQKEGLSDAERNAAIIQMDIIAATQKTWVEKALRYLEFWTTEYLSRDQLGEHGHFDYSKWHVAKAARGLLERWKKPVTYSGKKSPFAQIAYELCWSIGAEPTGMERVLKAVRDLP